MSIKSTSGRKRPCASFATKTTHDACLSDEAILAAIEHPEAPCPDADSAFWHILHCRDCRAALVFVCESLALEQDRKRQRAAWRNFRARMSGGDVICGDWSTGERIDAIAAGSPFVLVLQSLVADKDIHFWRATMTFPDVDQPEAPLTIRVEDAGGTPVSVGSFVIFGIEIPIANGAGQLTRSQFAKFHHKGGASFRWRDGNETLGAPILNT